MLIPQLIVVRPVLHEIHSDLEGLQEFGRFVAHVIVIFTLYSIHLRTKESIINFFCNSQIVKLLHK